MYQSAAVPEFTFNVSSRQIVRVAVVPAEFTAPEGPHIDPSGFFHAPALNKNSAASAK
jgi:hypothetical protein